MSAHATKKTEATLPALIIADDEWERHMARPGLRVIDVFAKWAGPCEPMQSIFKRLKTEFGDAIAFVQAQTDFIEALKNYRDKSRPTFLIFFSGVLVKIVKGANGPALEKVIKEQIEIEKAGGAHKPALVETGSEIVNPLPESRSTAALILADENVASNQDKSVTPESTVTPVSPAKIDETFALIKPDAMKPAIIDGIMEQIRSNRFQVMKMKKVWLDAATVTELYKEHTEKAFFQSLVTYFTSAPCLALILAKDNAVNEWRSLIGPTNPQQAKENAPRSIRALFGTDNRINAVFGSDSEESASREKDLFFGPESKLAELSFSVDELSIKNSPGIQKTLCLIKSEDSEFRNKIIERIICTGIEVHKRDEVRLESRQVEELFPGISAEESEYLVKNSVLALVLQGENVVSVWREMAGPEDPEAAKSSAPQSIRALYGTSIIRNAVHASLNAEKALTEVMNIFPHTLERGASVVLRDSRIGTSTNPYPANHQASVEELHANLERTLAVIKPDAYGTGKKDLIVDRILAEGFKIIKQQEVQFSLSQAQEFYKEHQTKPFYDELIAWMSGTPIYAMVLEKEGAVSAWRELAGPTNASKAKEIAPNSIRALYGSDGSHNAVHGSDAPISVEREMKVIFGDSVSSSPDPLPGTEAAPAPKDNSPRVSQTAATKAATKSSENVLSSSSKLPTGSRPGSGSGTRKSLSNLNKSVPKLSGSQTKLAGSQSNLSSAKPISASNPKVSGSISPKPAGSQTKLAGSQSNLSSAKPISASNPKVSGSISGSQAKLGSTSKLGSKSNVSK